MDIVKRDYTSYVDLLPDQFSKAINTQNFLKIFLEQDQQFFDELYKLFEQGLDIDTAVGYQLDIIGRLAGEYREERDDDEYREAVKFRQFINNSSGTIPEMLSYLKVVTEANVTRLYEHFPATVCMETDGNPISSSTVELADQSALGGVDVHSIIHAPNGEAVRPVEITNAYDNYDSGSDSFTEVTDKTDRLYYAIRPETDIYQGSVSLAGRGYMSAGNTQAIATGLTLIDKSEVRGKHPEVYVRYED